MFWPISDFYPYLAVSSVYCFPQLFCTPPCSAHRDSIFNFGAASTTIIMNVGKYYSHIVCLIAFSIDKIYSQVVHITRTLHKYHLKKCVSLSGHITEIPTTICGPIGPHWSSSSYLNAAWWCSNFEHFIIIRFYSNLIHTFSISTPSSVIRIFEKFRKRAPKPPIFKWKLDR